MLWSSAAMCKRIDSVRMGGLVRASLRQTIRNVAKEEGQLQSYPCWRVPKVADLSDYCLSKVFDCHKGHGTSEGRPDVPASESPFQSASRVTAIRSLTAQSCMHCWCNQILECATLRLRGKWSGSSWMCSNPNNMWCAHVPPVHTQYQCDCHIDFLPV